MSSVRTTPYTQQLFQCGRLQDTAKAGWAGLQGDPLGKSAWRCNVLKGQQDASLYLAIYPPRIPRWLRITLSWIIENVIGDAQFAALARDARPKSIAELYQVNVARKDLDRRLRTEIWDVHGLDAIIAPVQAMPTIPHGSVASRLPLHCIPS
jgi:hypothetical protein